jgi:hypothetical protein
VRTGLISGTWGWARGKAILRRFDPQPARCQDCSGTVKANMGPKDCSDGAPKLSYPIDHQERTAEIQWLDFSVRQPINPWTGTKDSTEVSSGSSSAGSAFDDRPVLMMRPVIERAIREEASDPIAAQAVAETMSWLDERREVIRSLRDSEPSTVSNSVFPFSWIRSVLGW